MVDYIFEVSWEVCNKVGGIYAVLSTKAKTLQRQVTDQIVFIGPWIPDADQSQDFELVKTPLTKWQKTAKFDYGIEIKVGRWRVPGSPIAILVDYQGLFAKKDEFYTLMWEKFGVDSLHSYGDYDESCAFGLATALVIDSLYHGFVPKEKKAIAQFHEWTTGMGLLYLKTINHQIRTAFTTHATSIGRSICGNGKQLYKYLPGYNGDQMADELNMQSKHSLEKAAAHNADVFTTVSEITAAECVQLLDREPLVTPNGFIEDFEPKRTWRTKARKRLLAIAATLTGKEFPTDTFMVATSGRNEFRNKGIDLYLDALNVLRSNPAVRSGDRHLLAFVLVPAWTAGIRKDFIDALNQKQKSTQLPSPIITHDLHEPYNDQILQKMNHCGFHNLVNEHFSIIYVPAYISKNDGLFSMDYYELLSGFDLTVFPSYYEPWGYTPQESLAMAVPTITTDLAGFGIWASEQVATDTNLAQAVRVMHRTDDNYHDCVHTLAEDILSYYQASSQQVSRIRRSAKALSKLTSWEHFIQHYYTAYDSTK